MHSLSVAIPYPLSPKLLSRPSSVLAHHPVLHSVSSTAVLTMTLPSDLSEAGGIKGSLQSPFSPLDLQV